MEKDKATLSPSLARLILERDELTCTECGRQVPKVLVYIDNATFFAKELLAVTYVVEDKDSGDIVAYFSLLNDKVDREFVDPSIWNNLSRKIPNAKRRSSYPALKIGRLAVSSKMKGQDIGTKIINYVQTRCTSNPSAGCRFITVDAYLSAVGFYQKCDFKFLVQPKPEDETALMFFDLKSILR